MLANVSWDVTDDGYVYFPTIPPVRLVAVPNALGLQPLFLGMSPASGQVDRDALVVSLVVDAIALEEASVWPPVIARRFLPAVGDVLEAMADARPDTCSFLANEAEDFEAGLSQLRGRSAEAFEAVWLPSSSSSGSLGGDHRFDSVQRPNGRLVLRSLAWGVPT